MAKPIFVVSTMRSGTSALGHFLSGYESVMRMGEVFAAYDFAPRALEAVYGPVPASDFSRYKEKFRDFRRDQPETLLRRLLDHADELGKEFVEMKLFSSFLPPPTLSRIVATHDCVGILIWRRPIDTFISLEKARRVNKYGGVDTTEIKPRLDARDFAGWHFKQSNHFQMTRLIFRKAGRPLIEMDYDHLYEQARPPAEVLGEAFREIGVELGEWAGVKSVPKRQDKNRDAAQKVANWDEFVADLGRQGRITLLDRWDLDGSRALLEGQMLVERIVPRRVLARALKGLRVVPR